MDSRSWYLRRFRARFMRLVNPNTSRRFFLHWKYYLDGTSKEAELRERKEVLNLTDFTPLRRENSALRVVFELAEYALGLDIPDEVFENEFFQSIYFAAIDMVCWSNVCLVHCVVIISITYWFIALRNLQDVYSYNKEQAMGHSGNNVITVLRNEKNIDIQTACDYVGVHFKELMDRFMADKERLPSFGPDLDASVARYVSAMGDWVIGSLEWSFEITRYFGIEHAEVKKNRVITLLPSSEVPEVDSENANDL